jgi:hypothetical protein
MAEGLDAKREQLARKGKESALIVAESVPEDDNLSQAAKSGLITPSLPVFNSPKPSNPPLFGLQSPQARPSRQPDALNFMTTIHKPAMELYQSLPEFQKPGTLPEINSIKDAMENLDREADPELDKTILLQMTGEAGDGPEPQLPLDQPPDQPPGPVPIRLDLQKLSEMTQFFTQLTTRTKGVAGGAVRFEAEQRRVGEFFSKFSSDFDAHFVDCCESLTQVFLDCRGNEEQFLFLVQDFVKEVFMDIRKNFRANKIKVVS